MGYETALSKAWSELAGITQKKEYSVQFLGDNYRIELENRRVLSLSCNIPAKDYVSILILHYLIRKSKGLAPLKNKWISFKELTGGQGYYPAFKKRVLASLTRKYGANPDGLLELTERFKARKTQLADISVILDAFEGVPLLITFWRGDEEFGPEVNVLFDKNIEKIFCTEDIVVLSEIVAHSI